MTESTLRQRIKLEIDRLSSDHQEETIFLINKVLRPMLEYMDDHNKLISELVRVSSKHGV